MKGYSEDQLQRHTVPGKWSTFENIAHLVCYQSVFRQRVDTILKSHQPAFERYVAENDPLFNKFLQLPIKLLLQTLNESREKMYQQLTTLSTDQLSLIGHHPKFGALTLVQWIDFFLLHEAHHLFVVFQLLNESRLTDK